MVSDMDRWQEHASVHARQLEEALHELEELRKSGAMRKFWTRARRVTILFRSLKPLPEDDRVRLWEHYRQLCEKAKSIEQHQHADRVRASAEQRELIEATIAAAHRCIVGATLQTSLNEAHTFLSNAMHMMRGTCLDNDSGSSSPGMSVKLMRGDHDVCWELWKRAKKAFDLQCKKVFDPLFADFRRRAMDALDAAMYGKPLLATQEVHALYRRLREVPLPKEQEIEIRDILRKTLEKAEEESRRQREESRERGRQWYEKQQEYVKSLTRAIEERQKKIAQIDTELARVKQDVKGSGWAAIPRDVRLWIIKMENRAKALCEDIKDMQRIIAQRTKAMKHYLNTHNVPEADSRVSQVDLIMRS